MSKLRSLSGRDVIRFFYDSGFEIESQRGSHAKLRRILSDGTRQTLTIPVHEELDKGTLRAIYRQALRYLPEERLKSFFYTE
jgi:predicted RNA binding protein YcfA (HicA-like mRNA interferase family)